MFFFNVPFVNNTNQLLRILLKWFIFRFNTRHKYITERSRIKYLSDNTNNLIDNTNDVAILIRGPIITRDDFTLNTILMYRKLYPKAIIYISTWNHEIKKISNIACNKNIKIITSEFIKPTIGYGSTNLQIKGNMQGLEQILKDNIKYTMTIRSDQRFYNNLNLSFLKEVHKIYEYKKFNNSDEQIGRLVGLSFNTFLYRLYGLSDMFLFGFTEDVFNYWNTKYDERLEINKFYRKFTMKEYCLERINEVYFMTDFLERNGHKLKWNLKDYWSILKNRFIVIDSSSLDFLWPKYSFIEERWKNYDKNLVFKEICFSDWLLIKNDLMPLDENIIDQYIN
tara:strand:+ start:337 stop:1350 length:1014 start_codon:yes stop_codon:yes gene_type:complete